MNDPELLALIAVLDIGYEEAPVGAAADFQLDGPLAASVVQGSPPVEVPLTIRRISGSTGSIGITLSSLPTGVNAVVLPNPAPAANLVLRLEAAVGPSPEVKTVVVTGTPLTSSAGPAPRTLTLDVSTTPKLRVSGSADIDFAGCAPTGAHGTVKEDYWISRHHSVNGPISVALENLPPDVTGTVDPDVLAFPGGATGQRVSVNLTTIAGPMVPDTWVSLVVVGAGLRMSFPMLVHGSCPQQNRNFVIRGQFGYVNSEEAEPGKGVQPLRGAQVEVFRYRSDWFDDRVGGTYTDDDGRFSLDMYASIDGDYYARLRLYSPEAQVQDADNSSVWSIDTPRQTNRGGLIDVGSHYVSRDDGKGTPRAAVWQGFHDAVIEFQGATGGPVPGGLVNVEIWRGHVTPLAFYSEVHWAHGYQTGEAWNPYRVPMHEFAHVCRDVLDGDEAHWHWDNLSFLYGRKHSACQVLCGTEANAGFAFHEGWAEYWSNDTTCCPGDTTNQNIEGTVAHHLKRLASCREAGRSGMVKVLQRGTNLIHSAEDFRREYALLFPTCPLGSIGDGCVAGSGVGCLSAAVGVSPRTERRAASVVWGGVALAASEPGKVQFALDPEAQRRGLMGAIDSRQKTLASLREEQRLSQGPRAFALRAVIEEGALVVQRMRQELSELQHGDSVERCLQLAVSQRRQRNEFVAQRRAIQVQALRDALAVVAPQERPLVERRVRLLEQSRIDDSSLQSMFVLPPVPADDTLTPIRSSFVGWLRWGWIVVVVVVMVLLGLLFRSWRRFGQAGGL